MVAYICSRIVMASPLYVYNDRYILCYQSGAVGKEPSGHAGNQGYLHQAWVHRQGKGRGTVSLGRLGTFWGR